eukprot:scaffold410533_cov18-Prasinocladus_malaysianus.AAC.1
MRLRRLLLMMMVVLVLCSRLTTTTARKISGESSSIIHARNNTPAPPTIVPWPRPQILWVCWLQGEEHLLTEGPGLNRLSLRAWRELNPDWQVNLVSHDNIVDYLPELDGVFNSSLRVQLYSDLVRLKLLNKYGGVWADLSTIPTRRLNSMVGKMMNEQGLFLFKIPKKQGLPPFVRSREVFQTWFIMTSGPGHVVIDAWARAVENVYRNPGGDELPYFQAFHELGDMYNCRNEKGNQTVRSVMRKMHHIHYSGATVFKAPGKQAEQTSFPACEKTRSERRAAKELCTRFEHRDRYFYMYKRPKLDWHAYENYLEKLVALQSQDVLE